LKRRFEEIRNVKKIIPDRSALGKKTEKSLSDIIMFYNFIEN